MAETAIVPVASKMRTLAEALTKAKGSMSAVAARIVTPDKLIKIALGAAQRTPLLLSCTPESIVRAVMQGAELGLTPGSALNQAYLVPFKNNKNGDWIWEAQLIISAQGLCELAYRSGLVSFVSVEVVYEGDEFEYELGLDPKLRHVPADETIDPDKITHAYFVVGLKGDSKIFRVMTRKAIDRIKMRSPSMKGATPSGPWISDYAEMAKKTVAKNGFKFVPKSIEVARAIALDNAHETGDYTSIDFDIPDSLPASIQEDETPPDTGKKATSALANKIKGKHKEVTLEAHLTEIGMDIENVRDFISACQSKNADPEKARDFGNAQEAFDWIEGYQEGSLGV